MRALLPFLLLFTLASMVMGQGFGVRSDGGFETNGTFYGVSTFRGSSGTLRLYGESSSANKKDFRLSSGSDLLRFMWVNDAGNSLLILGSADSAGNWSFDNSVTAIRFIGSGSNLTDIATSSLGFQPATNSYAGITNALGYQPATNGVNASYSTNAHASGTNSLDMSRNYADFSATTAMAITNFSNVDATRENNSVLMVTNGSGTNLVLYLTSGVTTMDGARNCVLTNNTLTVLSFSIYGNRFTNVAYRTFY